MKKKFYAAVLCLVLSIMLAVPVFADDEDSVSGTCGDNLTWTVDFTTGTLTISGTGDMYDYEYSYYSSSAPWFEYQGYIRCIVVEDGVTGIGTAAFAELTLLSVEIGGDVERIGDYAFAYAFKSCEYIVFYGDAPVFEGDNIFLMASASGGTAAQYPEGNTTWDEVTGSTYGGGITWVAVSGLSSEEEETEEETTAEETEEETEETDSDDVSEEAETESIVSVQLETSVGFGWIAGVIIAAVIVAAVVIVIVKKKSGK